MYSRILVPIDGSEHAHEGLRIACLLGEQTGAHIILLCVSEGLFLKKRLRRHQ